MTTTSVNKKTSKISAALVEDMIKLYDAGWSCAFIADQLGCSRSTVVDYLRRSGYTEFRPSTYYSEALCRLPHEEINKTVFLYNNMGYSIREVAHILGKAQSTIYYRLHRAGVQRRARNAQRCKVKVVA